VCNSLADSVVHVESTDIFKKQFDKFWSNQEINVYNYHADIQLVLLQISKSCKQADSRRFIKKISGFVFGFLMKVSL